MPIPETSQETESDSDAPYTSFEGSPKSPWGQDTVDADDMEATVASLAFEGAADDVVAGRSNLTGWLDYGARIPLDAVQTSGGNCVSDVSADQLSELLSIDGLDHDTREVLSSVHSAFCVSDLNSRVEESISRSINFGMRADSSGAPETHAQAMAKKSIFSK